VRHIIVKSCYVVNACKISPGDGPLGQLFAGSSSKRTFPAIEEFSVEICFILLDLNFAAFFGELWLSSGINKSTFQMVIFKSTSSSSSFNLR
jgi:hypothetical protein